MNLSVKKERYLELKRKFEEEDIEKLTGMKFIEWVGFELESSIKKIKFRKIMCPSLTCIGILEKENAILINDNETNSVVKVSMIKDKLYCNIHKSKKCEHVKFAMMLSELGKISQIPLNQVSQLK